MPVEVSFSEIRVPSETELEHHVMYAKEDDEEEDDAEDEDEDSNGGWLSDLIDWVGGLISSGTVSGGGVEPTTPPPRPPDFPESPPGTTPTVPPVGPRPTIPSSGTGWGGTVNVTVLRF